MRQAVGAAAASAALRASTASASLRRMVSGGGGGITIVPPRPRARGLEVLNETNQEKLSRAKGYPYPRPASSFIFINGAAHTFNDASWTPPAAWAGSLAPLLQLQVACPDGNSRSVGDVMQQQGVQPAALPPGEPLTPILAIGSNAAPEQLARKFPAELFPDGVVVPVVRCVLRGFDVTYAPLISSYGSCTATLEAAPGCDVEVYVTYLTAPLQQRMHETEGAYSLCKLEGVQLLEGISLQRHLEGSAPVGVQTSVYQYNHQHGTLWLPFSNPGRSPVALAEIAAHGRSFPALSQVQMLAALRTALQGVAAEPGDGAADSTDSADEQEQALPAADLQILPSVHHPPLGDTAAWSQEGLDEWIASNLEQPQLRRARVRALTKAAVPFSYERAKTVMTIGTALSESVK